MQKPNRYGVSFGIITNSNGEVLLLKRKNTGYFDDSYAFPAGRIEDGETSDEAMIREIKEEVGVKVDIKDLKTIAVLNRISIRQSFDICYFIEKWSGKIINAEPNKSFGIYWFNKDNLPEDMSPEMKIFLNHYFKFGKELKYYIFKK